MRQYYPVVNALLFNFHPSKSIIRNTNSCGILPA